MKMPASSDLKLPHGVYTVLAARMTNQDTYGSATQTAQLQKKDKAKQRERIRPGGTLSFTFYKNKHIFIITIYLALKNFAVDPICVTSLLASRKANPALGNMARFVDAVICSVTPP